MKDIQLHKLIKKYDSEKQCSKDLYLAESTLNSYLKGNVKNPMYDLRYLWFKLEK